MMATKKATTSAQALPHEVQDQLLRLRSKLQGALALLDQLDQIEDSGAAAMLVMDANDSIQRLLEGAPPH